MDIGDLDGSDGQDQPMSGPSQTPQQQYQTPLQHRRSNPAPATDPLTTPPTRRYLTWERKIDMVLALLQDNLQWSVGDLLYYLFQHQGEKEMVLKRTNRLAQMVLKFLNGQTKYKVSHILEYWKGSSDGLPRSLTLKGHQSAPPAKHMASKRGGLHTYTTSKVKDLTPDDSVSTFSDYQTLFKKDGQEDRIVTHALSQLIYSRNLYAKRLAVDKGILNFACRANRYLHSYDSRVGAARSYHASYEALQKLAASDLKVIQEVAQDPTSFWVLPLDNIQHYVWPRNLKVGTEAVMKIGTAGTVFLFQSFRALAKKRSTSRASVAESKRKRLYSGDQPHFRNSQPNCLVLFVFNPETTKRTIDATRLDAVYSRAAMPQLSAVYWTRTWRKLKVEELQ
ncbi:hypothetical protein C8J56DRAFT_896176 [Mycena floridula]|nr:hypothetical protein C8J56DRAFT_896176 [Mycena floridula]